MNVMMLFCILVNQLTSFQDSLILLFRLLLCGGLLLHASLKLYPSDSSITVVVLYMHSLNSVIRVVGIVHIAVFTFASIVTDGTLSVSWGSLARIPIISSVDASVIGDGWAWSSSVTLLFSTRVGSLCQGRCWLSAHS